MVQSSRRDTGSTPTDGSSSSSRRGRASSAQASPSFCFIPPRKLPGEACGKRREPGEMQQPGDAFRANRRIEPVQVGEQIEVLRHAQILVQTEALRHVADLGAHRCGVVRHVVLHHGDTSRLDPQQPGDDPEQGGLAGQRPAPPGR